jgi:probable phosphoglycerate mutase
MFEIYFVRHGETEWNLKGILQGSKNSHLTEKGKKQAYKLKEKLENIHFQGVYTSPLKRASETAEIIRGHKEEPFYIFDELKEMSFGKMEGIPKSEFKALEPVTYDNLWNNPLAYDPKSFDGESFQEVDDRVMGFMKKLVKNNPNGGRFLVVSHGMTLKMIFGHIWKHGLDKFWDDPVPENTSVTIVNYKDGEFEIEKFSDTSHLA